MKLNWKNEYYRYHRYFFTLQKATTSPKLHSFAWLSLTLFTISFFVLVAIRPTLVTIAKLNREIQDKKEANQKLQAKINSIIAAQQEYTQYLDLLPLLDEALPPKNDFTRLITFFEAAAMDNGVEIKALNFEKILTKKDEKEKKDQTAVDFSLGVKGDYLNLKKLLADLEFSRRIIMIEKSTFNLTKKEEGSELSLQVVGQSPFAKEIK